MLGKRELDLLVDISKLLKKHGSEPFETLAKYISSDEISQRLAELLKGAARIERAVTPDKSGEKAKKRKTSLHDELDALQSSDPRKHELIMKFYNDIQSNAILPTLRELKGFARDLGLPEVRSTSRNKSITPLMMSLLQLPTDDLSKKLGTLRHHEKRDRTLEGWSNLILEKEQSLKE